MGRPMKELAGRIFGWLVALEPTEKRTKCNSIVWLCHCTVCGNRKEVDGHNLRRGRTKSCGCMSALVINKSKVCCPQGHEYTEENTYTNPNTGCRVCCECRNNGVELYRQGNLEKLARKEATRRAHKLDQTPELSVEKQQLINDYYELSQRLGPEWHVDHIIPLSKEGLHCPDNLQIILAEDNLRKNNTTSYVPKIVIRITT